MFVIDFVGHDECITLHQRDEDRIFSNMLKKSGQRFIKKYNRYRNQSHE